MILCNHNMSVFSLYTICDNIPFLHFHRWLIILSLPSFRQLCVRICHFICKHISLSTISICPHWCICIGTFNVSITNESITSISLARIRQIFSGLRICEILVKRPVKRLLTYLCCCTYTCSHSCHCIRQCRRGREVTH